MIKKIPLKHVYLNYICSPESQSLANKPLQACKDKAQKLTPVCPVGSTWKTERQEQKLANIYVVQEGAFFFSWLFFFFLAFFNFCNLSETGQGGREDQSKSSTCKAMFISLVLNKLWTHTIRLQKGGGLFFGFFLPSRLSQSMFHLLPSDSE